MEGIRHTDNAQKVSHDINANLAEIGSQLTVSHESDAGSICRVLNDALGSELSTDMTAVGFCSDLNTLFEQAKVKNTFKFLHFSDTHGYPSAPQKAYQLIMADSDYQFAITTGDTGSYTYDFGSYEQLNLLAGANKLLMIAGNHDAYDSVFVKPQSASQAACTAKIHSFIGGNVVWGDAENNIPVTASYWHKDFVVAGGKKLRVLGIDQYERDSFPYFSNYGLVYTTKQLEWLVARLKELSSDDFVIVAIHEPQINRSAAAVASLKPTAPYDNSLLFVTEYLNSYDVWNTRAECIPGIIHAYMTRGRYANSYSIGGVTASIDADFTDIVPATFLCYLSGHSHCDMTQYIAESDYSQQLNLGITAADTYVTHSGDDDLGGSGSPASPVNEERYRINEVELDFERETIKVTRIGARNTAGGRVRDTIAFPFKKGGIL